MAPAPLVWATHYRSKMILKTRLATTIAMARVVVARGATLPSELPLRSPTFTAAAMLLSAQEAIWARSVKRLSNWATSSGVRVRWAPLFKITRKGDSAAGRVSTA